MGAGGGAPEQGEPGGGGATRVGAVAFRPRLCGVGGVVTPAEFAATVGAARRLIAWSDARDAEMAVRLGAERSAYAAGIAEGDRLGRAAVLGELAAERREVSAAVAEVLSHPSPRELAAARWHVCCRECRRRGHRDGCARCEDRAAATFGAPHPDDYPGAVAPLTGARRVA